MERIGDFDNVYQLITPESVDTLVDSVKEQVDAAIAESSDQIASLQQKRDELLAKMDSGTVYSLQDKTRDRLRDAPAIEALAVFHDMLDPNYIHSIFNAVREARLKGFSDKSVYDEVIETSRQSLLKADGDRIVFAQNFFIMNSIFDSKSESFSF